MRGNPSYLSFLHSKSRSIPAYAGEPGAAGAFPQSAQVYPRVCGGTGGRAGRNPSPLGLSPRMRGNRPRAPRRSYWSRSIPAYAGEPSAQTDQRLQGKVYPRVCGGTRFRPASAMLAGGLSPRMRGNRAGKSTMMNAIGSIPAYAGEPPAKSTPSHSAKVYPRVCGGTNPKRPPGKSSAGLSPRMRGNLEKPPPAAY